MKIIKFWKLSGAGNDFVGLNNLDGSLSSAGWSKLAKQLCHRNFGIGADGVLIIEPAAVNSNAHFKMRYFNADGSEAPTCGNGARCIARLALHLKVAPADMMFETLAGTYHAMVRPDYVTVDFPPVVMPKIGIQVSCAEFDGKVDFVDVGALHIVIFVDDLEGIDIEKIGRALRYHPQFHPPGANVNFVHPADKHTILVRTYERGVEAETLACGTGSLAAAIALASKNIISSPVTVITRSNFQLKLEFVYKEKEFSEIRMSGGAAIVFSGTIDLDALHKIFPAELRRN